MSSARALDHAEPATDAHSRKAQPAHAGTAKSARTKAAPSKAHQPAHTDGRQLAARAQKVAQVALTRAKQHASPLLVGAGIGATVAFAVTALRPRDKPMTLALFASPNSTFFSALVKTAAFAVERTADKGSLLGLVAKVVGKAIA